MLIHKNCKGNLFVLNSKITVISNFTLTTGVKPVGESKVQSIDGEADHVEFYCPNCRRTVPEREFEVVCDHCSDSSSLPGRSLGDFFQLRNLYMTVCGSCQTEFFATEPKKRFVEVITSFVRR